MNIQWHEDWNVYRMLDRLKGAEMSGSCKCTEEHLRYNATKESMRVCVGVAGEWDALVSLRRLILTVIIDIPSHCPPLS